MILLRLLMSVVMALAHLGGRLLPVRVVYALGRLSARVMYACVPAFRRALNANARYLLGPEVDRRRRRAFGVAVLTSFTRFFIELLTAPRTFPTSDAFFSTMEGFEHAESALARGKGVIGITLHLGNFELGPMLLTERLDPVAIVYRPDPFGLVERMRARRRSSRAVQGIQTTSSLFGVSVLKVLREQGVVFCAGDLGFAAERGDPYPFLGGTARFLTWPARLAVTSGAPIVPCFIVRQPDGGYRLFMEPAILPEEQDGVNGIMTALVDVYERYVRRYPEQWLILHPYWSE